MCVLHCVQPDVMLNTKWIGPFHTWSGENGPIPFCLHCLWLSMIRWWSKCLVCHAFIEFVQAWLFGHHALRCVIDGSRVKHYTPLSFKHDKECSCTHIFLQIHCHASVCALLQQKESLQEEMADWLSSVPIGYQIWVIALKFGRWPFLLADHLSDCS